MEERLRELIAKRFLGGNEAFGINDRLRDFGMTSLMFVELLLLLEEEFHIEIPDDDILPGRFATVARIAEYVGARQLGGSPPAPVCVEPVKCSG